MSRQDRRPGVIRLRKASQEMPMLHTDLKLLENYYYYAARQATKWAALNIPVSLWTNKYAVKDSIPVQKPQAT